MGEVYQIYDDLEQKKILLSFKGNVTSDLLTSILQIMESKLEKLTDTPKVRKKVFNCLVECLQNLYHHVDKEMNEESEYDTAMFMVSKHDQNFSIMTGNRMDTEGVEGLKGKLDRINEMSKEELKAYYKEVLNNGMMSDKGTAGLGMIDIARKSGHKLEYDFKSLNEENTFFSLTVNIA